MPESALLDQTLVAESLGRARHLKEEADVQFEAREKLLSEMRQIAEVAIRSTERVWAVWEKAVATVAEGQTEEVQQYRDSFRTATASRLDLLKLVHGAAVAWRRRLGDDGPDPDKLLSEIARLDTFKADVVDRWETAEDLEEVASRYYPLTTEELDRIGPHCPPPASWYAEEGKPF